MTIDELLGRSRAGLDRLDPGQAAHALAAGALLVDIRPEADRRREGEIPGSLVLDRGVLEWRLDPTSSAAIPEASYDRRVVLICNEGYTTSLAAATLQQLGLTRVTDLDGGFRAWCAAGLPWVPGSTQAGSYVGS